MSDVSCCLLVFPSVSVQVFPDVITTEEGNDVTMMCHVTGHPLPDMTWSRSEVSLPALRSIVNEGNLTILNVSTTDSGSYLCTARSIVGTNSSSVQLQVYSALKFLTRPPPSVLVYTGQTLNLSCSASSDLETTITWAFNGIRSLPQGVHTDASSNLIIMSLNINHGGNYTCSALNSVSSLQANVNVRVKIPETCSSVKANINDVSGNYVIDPDGEQGEAPFSVYCNMTDKGGVGVTAVSHNTEERTHVKGFDRAGSYSRDIQYIGASLLQIIGLIEKSKKCQQFIRYECKGSMFYSHNSNTQYAWWVSRDDRQMTYWSEASQGCTCGITSSCIDPQKLCNCDKNDLHWQEDLGILTNKLHLPVLQLRFGDTGGNGEEGYHTLGKLECYGLN